MRVQITIDCDNDAFAEEPAAEIGRILERLAGDLATGDVNIVLATPVGEWSRSLFDSNGNQVGRFERVS